jgi:hypothetical protein
MLEKRRESRRMVLHTWMGPKGFRDNHIYPRQPGRSEEEVVAGCGNLVEELLAYAEARRCWDWTVAKDIGVVFGDTDDEISVCALSVLLVSVGKHPAGIVFVGLGVRRGC